MPPLTRDERRQNRKHVLEALTQETGSFGGDAAAARVKAYCRDPLAAATVEFAYVGALVLRRFYVDESKPNGVERRSLWQAVTTRLGKSGAADPGEWDGTTTVASLQAMAEEA